MGQHASKGQGSSNEEAKIRETACCCLDFWCKNDGASKGAVCVNDACSVLSLLNEEEAGPVSIKGSEFIIHPHNLPYRVLFVKILPVGEENAAAVFVSVGESIRGWLTFLKHHNIWTCISGAFSSNQDPVLPEHFDAVNKLTWDGYCRANEACDAQEMAKYFHNTCRLTFAAPDAGVIVVDQKGFLDKVANRYENEEMHKPFAKLKNHPDLGKSSTLLSVEFATNDLCMVILKVGHPPCLWTDILTCCNMGRGTNQGDYWWIVHKSSCHETFPLTDDMKKALEE